MKETDISGCMSNLSQSRIIFHSENDFCHAFAIELHQLLNSYKDKEKYSIRFEKPESIYMTLKSSGSIVLTPVYIDIWVIDSSGRKTAIEVKYKTKEILHKDSWGDNFKTRDQSANDICRYSLRKDIYRVEKLISEKKATNGFVIFLTNEPNYWLNNITQDFMDGNYRCASRIMEQDSGWIYKTIQNSYIYVDGKYHSKSSNRLHWTHKNEYDYKLDLKREYDVTWHEFSHVEDSIFRYAIFEIS